MFQSDIAGVAFVYLYVAVLLIFTEKILSKRYPMESRKILHIMTGNIAFILPIFQTREIMAFLAAGPFILFTFLMSPYSPLSRLRRTGRCRFSSTTPITAESASTTLCMSWTFPPRTRTTFSCSAKEGPWPWVPPTKSSPGSESRRRIRSPTTS